MKQLLILFTVFLALLVSCKKDTLPLPEYWKGPQTIGWGKCMRNGVPWEGSAGFGYIPGDSTKLGFDISTVTEEDTVLLETLSIQLIPFQVGKYQCVPSNDAKYGKANPGAIFAIGYDDQVEASWGVYDGKDSYFTLESYDSVTKIVKGRFDIYLKRSYGPYTKYLDLEGQIAVLCKQHRYPFSPTKI
jgi:hypothetical protein